MTLTLLDLISHAFTREATRRYIFDFFTKFEILVSQSFAKIHMVKFKVIKIKVGIDIV